MTNDRISFIYVFLVEPPWNNVLGLYTIFGLGSSLVGLILCLTIWPYLHIPITDIPDKLLRGMFLSCLMKLFLWAFSSCWDCIRGLLYLGGQGGGQKLHRLPKDLQRFQSLPERYRRFFCRWPEAFQKSSEKTRRFPKVTWEITKIFDDYGRSPNISDSLLKIAEDHPMTATLSLLFMIFTSNQLFSCIFRICKFLKTDVILISLILSGPMLLPTRIVFKLHMVPSTPPKAG